ncbi:hypothetical protein [Streptomyces sp. NPDC058572]|uniref:hypothetical protein n=1 Tax=Streptomyces sp. NPDC058572 TaxID=3346546 RepID=UPI00365E263E
MTVEGRGVRSRGGSLLDGCSAGAAKEAAETGATASRSPAPSASASGYGEFDFLGQYQEAVA